MNIGGWLVFLIFIKDNHHWITIIMKKIHQREFKESATILMNMIMG